MASDKLNSKELFELESRLENYQGEDQIISSFDIYDELQKTEASVFRVSTCIPSIDRMLEQTEMGELIVITGGTGDGKTALAMTITQNMANKGEATVWFTLEVTPRQFVRKITYGIENKENFPLFYMPAKNVENHIKWIEERIIEAKVKFNIRAVFIDHIHQIFSLSQMKYGNVSLEIGDLVAKIKDMAIQHNLVVFLVAHTKDDPTGSTKEITKESIRDSGLISRNADTILGIWRIQNEKTVTDALKINMRKPIRENDTWSKIRILKNRRIGKLGTCVVNCDKFHLTEIENSGRVVSEVDIMEDAYNNF